MTDPARADLAARLREHADWDYLSGSHDILCDCGEVLHCERFPDGHYHYMTTEAHMGHLADVALAWFEENTTEERGIRVREPGQVARIVAVGPGYRSAPEKSRRVTKWKDA